MIDKNISRKLKNVQMVYQWMFVVLTPENLDTLFK